MQDTDTRRDLATVVSDSLRPIREQYWTFVRDCAEEITSDHAQHDTEDTARDCGDCLQAVEDTANGTEWTIYTRNAYLVLLVSDNADNGEEQLGADLFADGSLDTSVVRAAYFALVADLLAQLAG